jgi:hypothetical protein
MSTLLQPGDLLPTLELPLLAGDGTVPVGANRNHSQVLVLTHLRPCDDCVAGLAALGAIADRARVEKAEVMAVVSPGWPSTASLPAPTVVDDGTLRSHLGPDGEPVIAVVDRFGQLFTRDDAGPRHRFPAHDAVLATLLNIAISCPECGVPDVPGSSTLPAAGTMSGGMRIGQT